MLDGRTILGHSIETQRSALRPPRSYDWITVTIEQLDSTGEVYRTFTKHCRRADLDAEMHTIANAYNMARTRVTTREA